MTTAPQALSGTNPQKTSDLISLLAALRKTTPPASWDEKALEIAHQIIVRHWCDSRPEGRTARLQVAILEAMRWAAAEST